MSRDASETPLRGIQGSEPNERQFEQLVKSVGGIVWEATPGELQFTYVSPGAERILGYPAQRWTAERDFWLRHLHPEDREWAVPYCLNATRECRDHELEYRMIASDGRTVWLRDIVTVVHEHGTARRVCGVMVDISETKAAARYRLELEDRLRNQNAVLVELAKSEELSKGALSLTLRRLTEIDARTLHVERVGIWFFDSSMRVLNCVDQFESSLGSHTAGAELDASRYPRYFEALGRGRALSANEARTDPDTCEFTKSYLEPLGITSMLDAPIRRGGALVGVLCHEHVGPPRHWSSDEREFAASIASFVTVALEADSRSAAERLAAAARDELLGLQQREKSRIEEELRRAKAKLVRQTRLSAIGQIAASIAHELRNPLAVIRNSQFYLSRRLPDDRPEWSEHLEIIAKEVHSADRIINDLLEMSRPKEPGKQSLELRPLIQEALGRIEDNDGYELQFKLDPEEFRVHADPDQLRQVFTNLLTNSIQAMRSPGRITILAHRTESNDLITVRDEGPGIAEKDRERVFEPLFTRKATGTGLGLAICKQIIEKHGGVLQCSDDPGPGAAMFICLPRESA